MMLGITTACSTPHLFGPSQSDINAQNEQMRKLYADQQEKREKEEEAKNSLLKEGTPLDQFEKAFGKPDRTEYMNGVFYSHYKNNGELTIYIFKENKLTGWIIDAQSTANSAPTTRERTAEEYERDNETRRQVAGQSGMSFTNILQGVKAVKDVKGSQTNCASQTDHFGVTHTTCR